MKKQKIIVGNWKMNPTSVADAKKIFSAIRKGVGTRKRPNVIICPSFLHVSMLADMAKKGNIDVGVQNFFVESKGSYTGEVSIDMVRDAGATHVIIGHSERRNLGETDDIVNKKVHLALKAKMMPIICVGEVTREEDGSYYAFIKHQIERALHGLTSKELSKIIIAYEPVWAIGAANAMEAHDVHGMTIFIKKTLVDLYRIKGPVSVPILYGGSVDPGNAHGILGPGEADGLLIGRQSLVPESFLEIISIAETV